MVRPRGRNRASHQLKLFDREDWPPSPGLRPPPPAAGPSFITFPIDPASQAARDVDRAERG